MSQAGVESQTSAAALLVRPASFAFNPETAATNCFARRTADRDLADRARAESDALAQRLSDAGVEIHLLSDEAQPEKPDAVFPNNWVSFHADGTIVTYPMATPTRRAERQLEALGNVLRAGGFAAGEVVDLSPHEQGDRFLEGTGSLVLDRPRRRAYACLSPRTDRRVIDDFDARLGYSTFAFNARDPDGAPIYHTNVMMSLGRSYALICLATVAEPERSALAQDLEASGRTLIEVDFDQVRSFACNVIELDSARGHSIVALSAEAKASLRPDQKRSLERLAGELVDTPIPTIERTGGGSVRCMIAELPLPRVA